MYSGNGGCSGYYEDDLIRLVTSQQIRKEEDSRLRDYFTQRDCEGVSTRRHSCEKWDGRGRGRRRNLYYCFRPILYLEILHSSLTSTVTQRVDVSPLPVRPDSLFTHEIHISTLQAQFQSLSDRLTLKKTIKV